MAQMKDKTKGDAIFVVLFMALYYFILVRDFFLKKYIIWGDTYLHWSFKYLILYSLKAFNQLPWWDPTVNNGLPLYYQFLSNSSNYLGPFYLPSLVIFKVMNALFGFSINKAVLFHETVYVFFLVMIAVYLIAREIVRSQPARLLIVLLFTFSYFPLLNFHDFNTHEAMIPTLFYIYGLLRFNNRRTQKDFLLLLFFVGLLSAGLCNSVMMSAFFWTASFTFLLLLCEKRLLRDAIVIIGDFLRNRYGRILLALAILLVMAGFIASYLPVHYNLGKTLRYRGSDDGFDYFSKNKFADIAVDVESSPIWTVLSNWLPLSRFQEEYMGYGWDGHDHRYIGMITIPLLLAALLFFSNRYAAPLLLTYCICNTFIIYSSNNIVYRLLLDNFDFFRNMRNITSILSRGGGILFLIFLAGVGLDNLFKGEGGRRKGILCLLFSFLIIAGISLIIAGVSLIIYQNPLAETGFHIGWYLILFSGMCLALLITKKRFIARSIVAGLFVLTFLDLTISLSKYIDTYARIPWEESKSIPDTVKFGPIEKEEGNMFPSGYEGFYHNTHGAINYGLREWLVLATAENGQKILESWNYKSGCMSRYPYFHLIDKPNYLPLEDIIFVKSDPTLTAYTPAFYIHDLKGAEVARERPQYVRGDIEIKRYAFNEVLITTLTEQDSYLYFLDNYDIFWSAYINGKKTKIYRANFTFKAIELPAGKNEVRWVYNPYPIKYAYGIFYFLLAALGASYFLLRKLNKLKGLF